MNISLINAPVAHPSPHSRLAPPLGLAYIAAVLLEAGHEVSAVDYNVSGLHLQRVTRLVERDQPDIVGISAHTETYPNALKIAEIIKSLNPETKIVLGGPHPSILPREVLAEPAVDFIVIGEGEATMLELTETLQAGTGKFAEIKGLGYKDGSGTIRINERRPLLDPDQLPIPARELFPLEFYQDRFNVLAACGGCPFKCPFCSASFIWSGKRRARSPQNIMRELRFLMEHHGADYIFFSDDIFTLDQRWVNEIMAELTKLPYPLEWGCATRVDMVTPELLQRMAATGCRAIQYGVESGCQKILDSVKGIKKEQVLTAVTAATEVGIDIACSFMIPFPDDTAETIRETKEFMRQVAEAGAKILLSFTTPYPGTYFHQHADQLGLKILTNSWAEYDAKHNILETKYLSADHIDQLVGELIQDLGLKKATS